MASLNGVADALQSAINDMVEQALGEVDFTEKVTDAVDFDDLADGAVNSVLDNLDLEQMAESQIDFDKLFGRHFNFDELAEKALKNDAFVEAVRCSLDAALEEIRTETRQRAARAEEELAEVRGELFKVQSLVSELLRPRPTLYARLLALFGIV